MPVEQPLTCDVAILGGGLAGLSLALQLRQRLPDARIVVLERRAHPVPEAAHKVGESTVEIGAHYFSEVLGLKDHLQKDQLRKFGLRLFFNAGNVEDLADAVELGASHALTIPSYQIDRGIFENFLGAEIRRAGIEFRDGTRCHNLALDGENGHRVEFGDPEAGGSLTARWVVDAQSRASLIKRKLGLAEPNQHTANSAWFRISERLDIADWSTREEWQSRCTGLPRWLSTNHLMGPGYWVWLIPLASGSTSVGIVADAALHPLDTMNTFEKTIEWLRIHQPRCAREVERHQDKLQDFLFLRDYSHGCKQVFSADRWALTGEAGVFLDPFYSPGSDFIGISNGYITDLIARDLAGESIRRHARIYERLYFSFYESSLELYQSQYPLFGHPRCMSLKTVWDYTYYWGVLALLYCQNRLTDLNLMTRQGPGLERMRRLNGQVQCLLREWASTSEPEAPPGLFVNLAGLPVMARLNRELTEPADDDEITLRLEANFRLLERLAGEIRAMAPDASRSLIEIYREPENPPVLTGFPAHFLTRAA